MKRILIALVLIVPFQANAVLSVLDYTYLLVDGDAYGSAINNPGEILYLKSGAFGPQVISTRRGLIVEGPNVREPDLNDHGETVYADVGPLPGLNVYSSERGFFTRLNRPSINTRGEVAFARGQLWILGLPHPDLAPLRHPAPTGGDSLLPR